MTKNEAIEAMKQGQKVTHEFFDELEWVTSNPSGEMYTLEDRVSLPATHFWADRNNQYWENGWKLFEQL